jgi:hypothetical protein
MSLFHPINEPAKYILDTPPAITGKPPGLKILSGNMEGFTFPILSTCRNPSYAASIIPPSELENTSGIVESAKGLIASP